jgi:hypothetical protein
MNLGPFQNWLSTANLGLIGLIVLGAMCVAAVAGAWLWRRSQKGADSEGSQEGYIVSAVLGLLALLLGFTFSLAVDRFDARRLLVLEEANAIGTAYLRTQLLPEPNRGRLSGLLVRYTENRVALAKARPGQNSQLLAVNDALLTDIWAAAAAGFDSIKTLDFSSTFVESINSVIDDAAARKAARAARVPPAVFLVLFIYMVVTAGVLGYVLKGTRGRIAGGLLLALLTLSLMLIIDIDRPVLGVVTESQRPMEDLLTSLKATPPSVYDKWRTPAVP